jgi:hypothetical protein
MSDYDLKAEARGDLIIVTELTTGFFAVYTKAPDAPHLLLKGRAETVDHALLAASFQAAVAKARELGWLV